MLCLLVALACSEPPEQPTETTPPSLDDIAPEPEPFPPGVEAQGPAVSMVGHGIELTLNPPFQVASLSEPDQPELLIVAWWDVSVPGAGELGPAGLYTFTVVPGNPDATGPITVTTVMDGGERVNVLRKGRDGTEVRFPRGINGLGGVGSISDGPADQRWAAQIGGAEPIPFPSHRHLLHSWDPATGQAARFQLQPVRPWGPWPPEGQPEPEPEPEPETEPEE